MTAGDVTISVSTMSTEYSTVVCLYCGQECAKGKDHMCRELEIRVREIAREYAEERLSNVEAWQRKAERFDLVRVIQETVDTALRRGSLKSSPASSGEAAQSWSGVAGSRVVEAEQEIARLRRELERSESRGDIWQKEAETLRDAVAAQKREITDTRSRLAVAEGALDEIAAGLIFNPGIGWSRNCIDGSRLHPDHLAEILKRTGRLLPTSTGREGSR